jgi:hypothetical protein
VNDAKPAVVEENTYDLELRAGGIVTQEQKRLVWSVRRVRSAHLHEPALLHDVTRLLTADTVLARSRRPRVAAEAHD